MGTEGGGHGYSERASRAPFEERQVSARAADLREPPRGAARINRAISRRGAGLREPEPPRGASSGRTASPHASGSAASPRAVRPRAQRLCWQRGAASKQVYTDSQDPYIRVIKGLKTLRRPPPLAP